VDRSAAHKWYIAVYNEQALKVLCFQGLFISIRQGSLDFRRNLQVNLLAANNIAVQIFVVHDDEVKPQFHRMGSVNTGQQKIKLQLCKYEINVVAILPSDVRYPKETAAQNACEVWHQAAAAAMPTHQL